MRGGGASVGEQRGYGGFGEADTPAPKEGWTEAKLGEADPLL
jgi:hypothetical protein